jgi:hypothetical protein
MDLDDSAMRAQINRTAARPDQWPRSLSQMARAERSESFGADRFGPWSAELPAWSIGGGKPAEPKPNWRTM